MTVRSEIPLAAQYLASLSRSSTESRAQTRVVKDAHRSGRTALRGVRNAAGSLLSRNRQLPGRFCRLPRGIRPRRGRVSALGHRIRPSILRFVVQGGAEGTAAFEIQKHVDLPASTLSHHLKRLVDADLLKMRNEGTFHYYTPEFPSIRALTDYVWEDCCAASDSFAGIHPVDAPGFIVAQLLGAAASTALFRWLVPTLPNYAPRVMERVPDTTQGEEPT